MTEAKEEGPTDNEPLKHHEEEGRKLFYDAMKHLTTLNTGAILILTTFLDKMFSTQRWGFLIIAIFVSFIVSTFLSFSSMLNFAHILYHGENVSKKRERQSLFIYRGAGLAFVLGLVALTIFSVRNLF